MHFEIIAYFAIFLHFFSMLRYTLNAIENVWNQSWRVQNMFTESWKYGDYEFNKYNSVYMIIYKKALFFLQNFYFLQKAKKKSTFFTSPLFGGEIYTGNLLWTKYRLTFQDLGVVKKTISFRLDWKYLPSSNSDMWIFIKKLENRFLEYSISIFCHEIAHALGLSTWLS